MNAIDFLKLIFAPSDQVLFRPVETWNDDGKKQSRVDFKGMQWLPLGTQESSGEFLWNDERIRVVIEKILERSAVEHTNTFFGVCPRFGGAGQYDLAWQIRTVRVLWVDIDDTTVDVASAACERAGLPKQTITVCSGNGVHLYWLLDTPFLVDDDAGEPARVHTEWSDGTNKQGEPSRKPQKYIEGPDGEIVYLTKQTMPELSKKAQQIQDVLQGVAAAVGGDHTHDLSRLLRVPGSLNRKDERNGREAVPCMVESYDPDLRYPLSAFEGFAAKAPEKLRREKVAKVALPSPRKITPKKSDRLTELLAICDAVEVGYRSEADFSLCCYAVEEGISHAELWSRAQTCGKFAEGGEKYFDTTWSKAEDRTRQSIFDRVTKKAAKEQHVGNDDGRDRPNIDEIGLTKALGDEISTVEHFARDAGDAFYCFRDGAYRPKGERTIRQQVKKILHRWNRTSCWTVAQVEQVVEYLKVDSPELWDIPCTDLLNVRNGLLRISDRMLLPHTPSHLSTVQLPVTYDAAATCPAIDAFIAQVFPADAIPVAYELIAWLMLPDLSIQKSVLLLGEGANGKSRYLRIAVNLLGKQNVSSLSLHEIESDKFAVAGLLGMLANICADLPSEHLVGTSRFKKITGGDSIRGERKFGHAFDFTPFSRMVFSANYPPRSPDASPAFYRRWEAIPFDRTFAPDEQIPADVLDARLSTPQELSGLLVKALDALPRIRAQRGFSTSESMRRAWQDFHATTDPLAVWLERNTLEGADMHIEKGSLRAAYNRDAEAAGRPAMGAKAFGSAVSRLRPGINDRQMGQRGQQRWHYVGIGLRTFDSFAGSTPCQDDGDGTPGTRGKRNGAIPTRESSHIYGDDVVCAEEIRLANGVYRVDGVDGGCDHLAPESWIVQDDGMHCPGCGKWMARLAAGVHGGVV